MYVCICNAVSESQIYEAAADGARSVADLERTLGVATGCGCCAEEAERCLAEARNEAVLPVRFPKSGFQPA